MPIDAGALIRQAQAQQAATQQQADALTPEQQTELGGILSDRGVLAETFADLSFGEGDAEAGSLLAVGANRAERSAENLLPFGEFVEAPDFDFSGLEAGLSRRLGQGVAQGEQRALGSLARRGLLGSGAEAGVRQRAGESLGQGAVDIRERLALKQLNFDSLQAERKTKFNQAEALFNAGQVEAAQKLMLQYDALTAELTSRQQEGGNVLGTIVGGAGGFLAGGPQGALVGSQIGSTL